MKVTWTEEAVRALGVKTDVPTAGSIFDLSRAAAYKRVAAGTFPVPVIRVGSRLMVPTAPIRRLLQMDEASPAVTELATHPTTTPAKGRHVNDNAAA